MSLVLPGAGDVRDLVNGLLDRGVTVTRESQPVLPGRAVHVVGSYVDDTAEVRAVAMTDHLLGTVLGAALALVPPPRVEQAVNDGLVPPDLAENTREVLNDTYALTTRAMLKGRRVCAAWNACIPSSPGKSDTPKPVRTCTMSCVCRTLKRRYSSSVLKTYGSSP